jgi:hypothetical protein
MEIDDLERKICQSHLECWKKVFLTDTLYCYDYFPLCLFIYEIDMIHSLHYSIITLQISLMNGINSDVSW